MNDVVEIPVVREGANLVEVLEVMATRLESIGRVLESEHTWLKKRVDVSREIEDADIPFKIEKGWISEADVEELRSQDQLVLKRSQVDIHLTNLVIGQQYLNDIATYIRSSMLEPDGGAA